MTPDEHLDLIHTLLGEAQDYLSNETGKTLAKVRSLIEEAMGHVEDIQGGEAMSGKKAQALATVACGELRIDYSIDPSHSGKVDAHNVAIIADAIQEGMRPLVDALRDSERQIKYLEEDIHGEDPAKYFPSTTALLERIAALMEEQ